MKKHILFDVDGTLLDSEEAVLLSFQETIYVKTGKMCIRDRKKNDPDCSAVADPQIQQGFGINAVNQRGSGIVGASLGQDTHRIKNLEGADRTDYQSEEQLG